MENKKIYPVLSARIQPEQKKRFEILLEAVQKRQAYVKDPDLVRILLGFDKRVVVSPEERAFLAEDIPALHGTLADTSRAKREKAK